MTDTADPTADRVIGELERRGTPVFRANPGDFPQRISLAARLDQTGLDGTIRLHDRHGNTTAEVRLRDVGCVYYRRPTAFRIPDDVPEQWQWWAAREARQGFGGVISALPRWMNHPAAIGRAEYKAVQLRGAAACGLTIPRTLITNDPQQAKEFADDVGATVHKRLSGAIGPGDPFTPGTSHGDPRQRHRAPVSGVAPEGVRCAPDRRQRPVLRGPDRRHNRRHGDRLASRLRRPPPDAGRYP
ncbi:MAG: MvdC/MvdD family ATP grasp protein [Micromonosporaceae bacterium]